MPADTSVAVAPALPGLLHHVRDIVRLAVPVALSRVAMLLFIMTDVAMLGRYDSAELAFYGLGNAVQMVLLLIGIGMLVGTAVLTAQAVGAQAPAECGLIWRVGLLHAVAIGILFMLLSRFAGPFFGLLGLEPGLSAAAGRVAWALALGFPPLFVFVCSTLFLEALNRPRAGLVVALAGNAVNLALNALFIEGRGGLPALGAEGAAYATSAARWCMALLMVGAVLLLVGRLDYNIVGPWTGAAAIARKLRRLGYPLGLAQGLESAAFSTMSLFAGYLGAYAVAAHQVAMQMAALAFMAAVGIGTATAVKVGNAVGAGDRHGMALAGWAGVLSIAAWMAGCGVALGLLPRTAAGLFTDDPVLLTVVLPALLVVAVMLVPDGVQGVLMGALRGLGDVWVPTGMHLFSFLGIMVPMAGLFALVLEGGVAGLYWGACCGVCVASLLLAARFRIVSGRTVTRL